MNFTEAEERAHLEYVRSKLKIVLDEFGGSVRAQFSNVMKMKRYLQESKTDMDHIEKADMRESIDQMTRIGEHNLARGNRIAKLYQAPYFGRIDFTRGDKEGIAPVYIGVHAFQDEIEEECLIHDWRAPISSMFYDFELGDAFFDAPDGRVKGRLLLKRQYRIKEGVMSFMLETSLNIHDEVLQQELSRTSDNRMRNIVATIQRDQNAIIRNDSTHALVIQGAAGSGKTSIALHRIAFLLYKFKDSITSSDILIISPNKIFADYIAQVLPELGEEMIKETTMETLAAYLFDYNVKFQTFADQVSRLLENDAPDYVERIRLKSTAAFLEQLHDYARHVRNTNLVAVDLEGAEYFVPASRIERFFNQCGPVPYAQQVGFVHESVVNWIKLEYGFVVKGRDLSHLRSSIKKMVRRTNLKILYRDLYTWLGKPEMFRMIKGSVYEYADVFPMIYLGVLLEGVKSHDIVKHLVVDEMQDYTPVQYQVLARLFECPKTILGDSHQSVNPFSASTAEVICGILPQAESMAINKSYRSTLQITNLAQRINRNELLEPVERHGEEPDVAGFAKPDEELDRIRRCILAFLNEKKHNTLGVICKTQSQANKLHQNMCELPCDARLLDDTTTTFSGGVVVASAHMSKGLEFDQVIVPFCDETNYHSLIDRHMLYVACTRAMHKLTITHTGCLTPFLKDNSCRSMV